MSRIQNVFKFRVYDDSGRPIGSVKESDKKKMKEQLDEWLEKLF